MRVRAKCATPHLSAAQTSCTGVVRCTSTVYIGYMRRCAPTSPTFVSSRSSDRWMAHAARAFCCTSATSSQRLEQNRQTPHTLHRRSVAS